MRSASHKSWCTLQMRHSAKKATLPLHVYFPGLSRKWHTHIGRPFVGVKGWQSGCLACTICLITECISARLWMRDLFSQCMCICMYVSVTLRNVNLHSFAPRGHVHTQELMHQVHWRWRSRTGPRALVLCPDYLSPSGREKCGLETRLVLSRVTKL